MQISVREMDTMAVSSCENDRNCVKVRDPSHRNCPVGLGRSLDSRWVDKLISGRRELGDRVVCCKAPQTPI